MTSETSKLGLEKELKCSPREIYHMLKSTLHQLCTICPEVYKGCDIIEGHAGSVGSVRLWKYVLPGSTEVLVAKDKTEVIDDANMLIVLNVYEGNVMDYYKSLRTMMQVIPKGEGCLVNWTLEYVKINESAIDPHAYITLLGMVVDLLDAHLLA